MKVVRLSAALREAGVAGKIFGAFGASLAAALLTFAFQVMAARVLDADDFGKFVVAVTVLGIAGLIAPLGFQNVFLRFLTEAKLSREYAVYQLILSTGRRYAMLGSLGAGIVCFAIWGSRLSVDRPQIAIVVLVAVSIPLTAFSKLWVAQLRVWGYAARAVYLEVPLREGSAAIYVALAIVSGARLTATDMSAAYFAGILTSYVTLRLFGARATAISPTSVFAGEPETKAWWSLASAAVIVTSANLLLKRMDILILGGVSGYVDAGAYNAAARIADVLQLPLVAANVIVAPKIAELYAAGKMNELRFVTRQMSSISLALCCLMAIVPLAFPRIFLGLFGDRFTELDLVLRLLIFAQLVNAATGGAGLLLTMTGGEWRAASITLVTGVSGVLVNYMVAVDYGVLGVSLCTAASICIWNLWLCAAAYRHTGILTVPVFGFRRQ